MESKLIDYRKVLFEEKAKLDSILSCYVDKSDIERLRLIPAVSFECEMGEGIPLVASDHIKGGELAANLLFRCGCKNVAILSIKATAPVYARRRITECQRLLKKKRCKSNDCRA